MNEIVKIIDPGGTGDYASLLAAEAGLKADYGDLVNLESILRLKCISSDGSADAAGTVTFSSADWTTNDDYYIIIEAGDGHRCNGLLDTSKYRHSGRINLTVEKAVIDGIAISSAGFGIVIYSPLAQAAEHEYYIEIKNCFIKSASYGSIYIMDMGSEYFRKVKVSNCVLIHTDMAALYSEVDSTIIAYNITAIGTGADIGAVAAVGYSDSGTFTGKNIIAYGHHNDYSSFYFADFTATLTNCASEDGSADDYNGSGNRVSQTFKFFDSTNDDYRIHYKDTAAQGRGVDLRSDSSMPVTHDSAGKIRLLPFDIGAFRVSDPEAMFNHDFYNLIANEIGINITHHYSTTTETLNVIFHDPYQTSGPDIPVESQDPRIWVKAWQVDNITRSSYFTIMGTSYYIREMKSEYHGMIEIILTEDNQK